MAYLIYDTFQAALKAITVEVHIRQVGDSWQVYTTSHIHKNKELTCPTLFSLEFTVEGVLNSHEVQDWLAGAYGLRKRTGFCTE